MTKEEIMEAIEGMTVLELSELVKAMEEKFGVSAAAPVAVYSGGCTSHLTFVTPIGQPTTTQAKFWVACLDSSATNCSIVVNIHVMGKWK